MVGRWCSMPWAFRKTRHRQLPKNMVPMKISVSGAKDHSGNSRPAEMKLSILIRVRRKYNNAALTETLTVSVIVLLVF